jgi:diguanylate cyclase (GGDEF)-like protein
VAWDASVAEPESEGTVLAVAPPGLAAFARAWAKAVAGTSYLPMTRSQLEDLLCRLAERLAGALSSDPFDQRAGQQVGADLVAAHIASAEGLGRTLEVIQLRLLPDLGLAGEDLTDRMARLLAAVGTGYARALRDRTLDEQESVRRAAMVAREQAEQALRQSEARFRYQATHDSLTGLPNRTLFSERLANAVQRRDTTGRRVGLCFLDLDEFKRINDTLGHQFGDRLLASVAHRLDQATGEHLVARLGGDEFVILIEQSDGTDEVLAVAEAALAAVGVPALVGGHELTVSASIGVVERPVADTSPSDLMRAADVTLRWAKASGKGRWALFDPERYAQELDRYALSSAIPEGLERGEFFLDFQPMVSLNDSALLGVEALVRWRHPELGVLGPDRFITLAEETGLIIGLGDWVLAEACRTAREWVQASPIAPFISVNLAVRQVQAPGLVNRVTALLTETGLPPKQLQLEITESALMSSSGEPVNALKALSDLGVRIAIDDFGTGYSNLAYLRNLPVTELKVAGSFVTGLRRPTDDSGDHTDERILAALVTLAHSLDLTVTAEGVETAEQADRLHAIGCDAAQGWYFGMPGPTERIMERLRRP